MKRITTIAIDTIIKGFTFNPKRLKISPKTAEKVRAENELAEIFASQRKKPIIYAKNPPNPSLLKL